MVMHPRAATTDDALALSRRGLSVFAVPPPDATHDGKKPAAPWKEFQHRRATEDELQRMFARPMNVAIVTGEISDVVVVDLDSAEAISWARKHLRPTPWLVATARGYHTFYKYPGQAVPNRARLNGTAVDVRGDGGYVVGPGSVHASGHVYRAIGDWSAARDKLPVFDVRLLERPAPPAPARPAGPRPRGDVAARARRYLRRVPCPPVGQGSDAKTFEMAARLVRGFGLAEADAVELLLEWSTPHGFDRRWIASKVRHALAYGTEEIGGMR